MSNQTVLITGSSSGFGLLTAKTLAAKGHTVFATMRDPEGRNAAVAGEIRAAGDNVHVLDLDVTSDESVAAAVATALETAGHLDVVVNNAGVGVSGLTEGFTVEQFRALYEINVFGVHRVNRAVLPSMRERGSGLLVHVSSGLGRLVIPFAGPYTSTKFALEALAETYRYELSGLGIDVVIVQPGAFGTDFGARMFTPDDKERDAGYGPLPGIGEQMWSGILAQLKSPDAPKPQLVADAIAELIDTPAGKRPFRTMIDPSSGNAANVINEVCEQVQEKTFEAFGMSQLRTLKTS